MLVRTVMLLILMTAAASAQTLGVQSCMRLADRQITGLSSITWAGGDIYIGALERGSKLLKLTITLKPDGSIASARPVGLLASMNPARDIEGIAFTRPQRDSVLLSDESGPGINEIRLSDGKLLQSLKVPAMFAASMAPNQGFESLTFAWDHAALWTANERALRIDGNPMTAASPMFSTTRVRLQKYAVNGNVYTPAGQFEYDTSGVHDLAGQIGLCDLAALPDGRLLALERSAAMNLRRVASIRTRIFLIDAGGATDVSKPPFDRGLGDRSPRKVKKTLLFDDFICSARGENLEGLCIGPALGKNRRAVIGVIDDTDGGLHLSHSAVVSFVLDLPAPPTSRPATAP
jgi:hypothetical protein